MNKRWWQFVVAGLAISAHSAAMATPNDAWIPEAVGETAQEGGDDLLRLVTAESRCITSADELSLTLRRVKLRKDAGMNILSRDKEAAFRIGATVSMRDNKTGKTNVTTVTTVDTYNLEVLDGDVVVLPAEIPIASFLPLKTAEYRITALDLRVAVHVKRKVGAFGRLIQSFKNFEPITSLLFAAASPYVAALGKFAGVAIDESMNDETNLSRPVFDASADLKIDPQGECAHEGDAFSKTGILALVRKQSGSETTCLRPNVGQVFSLLHPASTVERCDDTKAKYVEINNQYLMFAVSASRPPSELADLVRQTKSRTGGGDGDGSSSGGSGGFRTMEGHTERGGDLEKEVRGTVNVEAASHSVYNNAQGVRSALEDELRKEQALHASDAKLCALVQGSTIFCRP